MQLDEGKHIHPDTCDKKNNKGSSPSRRMTKTGFLTCMLGMKY